MSQDMTEIEIRGRRRHLTWRYRLFFAIGCILAASNWLTLLPALWWSDIGRNAAAGLTIWFLISQVFAFWLLWRWLGPYVKGQGNRSKGKAAKGEQPLF